MPGEKPVWSNKMDYDYGFIVNTMASDGEGVDTYVDRSSNGMRENYHKGENEPEMIPTDVYVVHQLKIWHSKNWNNGICPDCHKHHTECSCPQHYDEDKVMLGFKSKDDAIKAYLRQYDSEMFLGPVSTYSIDEFHKVLKQSWGKKIPSKEAEHEHWHGFDLDGTLAKDDGWKGKDYIGDPIEKTRERIQKLLSEGKKVKLFTARAADPKAIPPIQQWMKNNNIPLLEITNKKDPGMISLEDDRAIQVRKNTGNLVKSIPNNYYLDYDRISNELYRGEFMLPLFFSLQDFMIRAEELFEEYGRTGESLDDFVNRTVRKIKDKMFMDIGRTIADDSEYKMMSSRVDAKIADTEIFDNVQKSCGKEHNMDKSYLGQPGDQGGSHAMLKENLGESYGVKKKPILTMFGAMNEIEKCYPMEKNVGESLEDFTRRKLRSMSGDHVQAMHGRGQSGELEKAFVKVPAHTRNGKRIPAYTYFTDRERKVADVRHTKKTRVDYDKKDAEKKIAELEKKKEHNDINIEAAKDLKEKVEAHKKAGNTHYKAGTKEIHVDEALKHLNDHIEHHTNEKKSHDNHIAKIKDRYKTEQAYWDKQKEARKAKESEKQKAIDELVKDGKHGKEVLSSDVLDVLKKMKEEKPEEKKAEKKPAKEKTMDDFFKEYHAATSKDQKASIAKRAQDKFMKDNPNATLRDFLVASRAYKDNMGENKEGIKPEAVKKKNRSEAMKGNKNARKFGSQKEYTDWLRKQPEDIKDSHKLSRVDGVLTATWGGSEEKNAEKNLPVSSESEIPNKIVVPDDRRTDYTEVKTEGVPKEKTPEIDIPKPKKDWKPKIIEKDGNTHFDFSGEPVGEISIPEFKSTGFTKFTKKDLEMGGISGPLQDAVNAFTNERDRIKSEYERDFNEENKRLVDKGRDSLYYVEPKFDAGYQIVNGKVFVRMNVQNTYGYYYSKPDKVKYKKKTYIISPNGKKTEAGQSWRDEIKVQREVYVDQVPMSDDDKKLIGKLLEASVGNQYKFFQKAEYDPETNTIRSEVNAKRMSGEPDKMVTANLSVPRFLHLLAHYNSKQNRGFSSGYVVPEKNLTGSVKEQIGIFREDNRAYGERISSSYYEAYLKGLETSFGEKNAKDTLKEEYGVKIKRQNGKPMTNEEVQMLRTVIDHTYNSMGNPVVIRKFAEERGLKISFSGDKNAFLRKAVGLYVPTESTVVVGPGMREVMPHEMTHFLDDVFGSVEVGTGTKGRGNYYASEMPNTDIGMLTAQGRRTFYKDERTKGAYWNRSCEVFARMVEQYAAKNDGRGDIYYGQPGYWSKEEFSKLEPKIVAVLKANLGKSFAGFFPTRVPRTLFIAVA